MRRPMLVLVTALAVVLAGCTGSVSSGSPPGGTSQALAASPAPGMVNGSAAPSPSVAADAGLPATPTPQRAIVAPRWTRVADQPAFAAATMTGVAMGPGGYVAVGCNTITADTSTNCVAGAWRSPDGRAWTRVALPAAAMVDGDMQVVGDGAGYVAWGGLVEPEGRVEFWASSDGSVWQSAPLVKAFDGAGIGSVVRYGDEWLASGGAGDRGAIVLASPDGVTWGELPFLDETGAAFAPGIPIWSLDILVATRQALVGFGPTTIDDQVMSATFRSTDGRHWSTSVDLPRGVSVTSAVAAPGGIATFWRLDSDDASLRGGWQSTGGSSWTAAAFVPPAASGGMGMLTNGGGAWYGLGAEDGQPAARWSVDGISWLATSSVPDAAADGTEPATGCTGGPCVDQLPRTEVSDIAGTPDGFIAVGGTHLPGGGYEAVVWVASTELAD